jgi:acetolactate synthase I/II/III large subunit
MKKNGAEILVKMLELHGIKDISGIPGGSILPVYHALSGSKIRHILARHEQGAGFIAQGMARSTGRPAVCLTTSGPGATNLVTALADAKSDSVPIIAITGQVPAQLIGTNAFQEVDICSIASPVVKKAFQIQSVFDIPGIVNEAFRIASEGRPGPVLIDIPKDVQMQEINQDNFIKEDTVKVENINIPDVFRIAQMIKDSKRPILYTGGGIVNAGASEALYRLAVRNHIPVVTTLMGLGSFPAGSPLFLGLPGMHGMRSTNLLLQQADLLLAFGVRFDDRVTGKANTFCPDATIIHVDIDPTEIGKIRRPDYSVVCDINHLLKKLSQVVEKRSRDEWMNIIDCYKDKYATMTSGDSDILHPLNLIRAVNSFVNDDTIITTDVGQHQMWVAQNFKFMKPRTFLTSGGQGTMGFGLPAAIGAAIANPSKSVISFCGDGSILMNIQELSTLADLGANVHILVMNNGHLGMVRQQQELFYSKKYIASCFETRVDYAAAARAFGIHAYDLKYTDKPMELLERALKEPGPNLINVPVESDLNVYPIVPPGAANVHSIG